MKTNCTKCGQNMVVSDDLIGQQVRCPSCEFVVTITPESPDESVLETKVRKTEQPQDSWEAQVESPQVEVDQKPPVETDGLDQDIVPVGSVQEMLPWENAAEWFLRIPEGLEFGPITREQLDEWVRQGRVCSNCELRYDQADWQAATEIYSELVEDGNPFRQPAIPAVTISAAPSRHLEPHRGSLVLSLAVAGCIVPFLSVWPAIIGTRDLRLMSLGKMDPSGNAMTRSGQAIAMVASMIWFGAFAIAILALLIRTMSGISR